MKKDKRSLLFVALFLIIGALSAGVTQAPRLFGPSLPRITPSLARPLVVTALLPTNAVQPTLPTAAPTPTQEVVTAVQPVETAKVDPVVRAIVTAEPGLNVRQCAGLKCAIVGSVKAGTTLSVKNGGDWAEIVAPKEYAGKFVAAKYLKAK